MPNQQTEHMSRLSTRHRDVAATPEGQRFIAHMRAAILSNLPAAPREATLIPYRDGGHELLGLDLSDRRANVFALTFHIGDTSPLPEAGQIGAVSADVGVADMTDALQLARDIVHAVNGNAITRLLSPEGHLQ